MPGKRASLDEFLENVLRGAAKIVGCNSTHLVVISEKTRSIQIRVGITEVDYPVLAEMERDMGVSFRGISVPLDAAAGGLILKVWQDGSMRESSSLLEMAGSAIDAEVIEKFEKIIGEHRYIMMPAVGANRQYGVLVFEKEGTQPFSRQQREVLLRYARRIGDIIENDLRGQRKVALQPPREQGEALLEYHLMQLSMGEPSPTVYVDPEFGVTSCNEAFEELVGKSQENLVGKSVLDFFRDPAPVARLLNQQLLYPNTATHEESAIILRGDQSMSATRVEALLLADDHQRVVGFLLLVHVEESRGQWTSSWLVQQEQLATMGEMAAQLAHEIRNPLVAIGATLESLGRDLDEDRHRRLVGSAAREIARLDMILKKYLTPRQDISFSEVRVADVLDEVRDLLAGARRLSDKRITVDVGPDVVVQADHDSLKHVFFNLILNALEASPSGEEVHCRAESTERDVSIYVEDRGPGLSASAEQCFKPFFTAKPSGTGLGLAVCQKLVRVHGGVVELRNRVNGGCRAVVVLPRQRLTQAAGVDMGARS
jgi:PAS domain S-box-containing protein